MEAFVIERPDTFDLVARVKEVTGQVLLPGDETLWILGQPLVVVVDGREHVVPAGFVTDGISAPPVTRLLLRWHPLHPMQFLLPWDPWGDPQRWAGIVHDWLYTQHGMSRSYADHVFRALLVSEGVSRWRAEVLFRSAVLSGENAYLRAQMQGPIVYPPEV